MKTERTIPYMPNTKLTTSKLSFANFQTKNKHNQIFIPPRHDALTKAVLNVKKRSNFNLHKPQNVIVGYEVLPMRMNFIAIAQPPTGEHRKVDTN
jgi:hypothetical protein